MDNGSSQDVETLKGSISVDSIPRDREPSGIWHAGSRELPLPRGASEALRDSIASTPQPDLSGEPLLSSDEAALRELVAQADAITTEGVQILRDHVGASVTPDVIDGVDVFNIAPAELDPRHEDHLFIYVHGGAYVLNAGEAGTAEAIVIAHRLGIRAVSIDYRMAPDHPLPAGVDDVMAVYRHIVGGRPATSVALGGSSGGGNLSTVVVQQAVRDGVAVPGVLYLGTPGNDMTDVGDSLYINRGIDRNLPSYDDYVNAVRFHANGRDLADPMVSPIYGSFDGFPPTMLVTGTRDLLLSATVRTHIAIRGAGSIADLLVFEGVAHGDYANPLDSPESRLAYAELNRFVLEHLS
jgi:acetyl esterase/lipase